jgi:hypothetical protein
MVYVPVALEGVDESAQWTDIYRIADYGHVNYDPVDSLRPGVYQPGNGPSHDIASQWVCARLSPGQTGLTTTFYRDRRM